MIKPSSFFPEEAADDLFLAQQRKAKLEGYVQTLAAMDELIDFAAMAAAVDNACPRADRSKGRRPPYPTEVLVRSIRPAVRIHVNWPDGYPVCAP